MQEQEWQEGQLSKEEFEKKGWLNKTVEGIKKAKEKVIPVNNLTDEDLAPNEIEVEISPEQMQGMQLAEEEVQQRQMIEYKEKIQTSPESQSELDNKLLTISASLSKKKELMPAKDAAGIIRNIAIELEEEYPEPFTEDMIKGNYGDFEAACIFGNGSLINAMKTIGQAKDFSFVDACRFNKGQMDLMMNISRGKNGFSAILVKTDKHVSEGVVSHVQRAFQEKKEKRWGMF